MKYLKTFEFFKPIKVNSDKPMRIKKGLLKSAIYLQKGIKSDRKRLEKEKDPKKRHKLNDDKNRKIKKLSDVNFRNLKQIEYLRNNPIKENVENSEDLKDILLKITEGKLEPETIKNYVGIDESKYEFDTYYSHSYDIFDDDGCTILLSEDTLSDIMNVEGYVISHVLSFSGYNDYEYYVDDEELNYLHSYLPSETLDKIKELSILFGCEIDPNEEGEINNLFDSLGLNRCLRDFKYEIASENEIAIKKAMIELVKSLPFNLDKAYAKKFDIEIKFDYDDIIEYINKNNLKVKTLKEFIENVKECYDFSYDYEYEGKEKYMGDFKGLINEVGDITEKYIDNPDNIFPFFIEKNKIEEFKKNIEKASFNSNYSIYINYNNTTGDLFEIANMCNNDITKWFKTYKFQKEILDSEYNDKATDIYKNLKNTNLINPDIEEEYEYLSDSDKYNL